MIFYTDKPEIFECNISAEGTSLSNTKARLILEGNKWNLVFYGNVNNNGKCSINIDKLHILDEGDNGKIRLEVIADDTLFVPWSDNFTIKKSKKVTVEVVKKNNAILDNKTKITVSNTPKKQITTNKETCLSETVNRLKLNNINLKNFEKNKILFKSIISEQITKHNINNAETKQWFIKSILDFLAK